MGNTLKPSPELLQALEAADTSHTLLWTSKELTGVPKAVIECTKLRTLNLSRNKLYSLPDQLSALTGLTSLFVNQNALERMPSSMASLTNLTTLSLTKNNLATFPQMAQLHSLTELELQENAIVALPDDIGGLRALKHLNVNRNKLTALPSSLSMLTELRTLNATDNMIASLPDGLTALSALRYLVLSGNRIAQLTDEMCSLASLETLLLDQNKVTALPEALTKLLLSRAFVDLRMNPLLDVPSEVHRCDRVYVDFPSDVGDGVVMEANRLFLGNIHGSENRELLGKLRVSHVARVIDAKAQPTAPFPAEFKYLEIECNDDDEQDMRQYFEKSNEWIEEAIARGNGVVLVHCRQGKSRSATIVLAYLIGKRGMTFANALSYLQQRRAHVEPNRNFASQLEQYERDLL